MDNGIYSLMSGAYKNHLDLIVQNNNAANMNSVGFKEDYGLFNSYNKQDAIDNLALVNEGPTVVSKEQGQVKFTGRPLDVSIMTPNVFLKLSTPNGVRYSRAGNFSLDNEGNLVDPVGNKVLTSDGQEIVFTADDSEPEILSDGTIRVNGEERGQLGLVTFENSNLIRKLGNGLLTCDQDEIIADEARISQGALEESNVVPVKTMTNLIELQRTQSLIMGEINQLFSLQRNAIRVYGKIGG